MNHLPPELIKHLEEDKNWQKHLSRDITELQKNHDEVIKRLDSFIERSEPMITYFEGITFTKRFILGFVGFIVALLGLFLMIRQLFKD